MVRTARIALIAGCLAAWLPSGCTRLQTAPTTMADAHVLRIGIQSGPTTLNPLLAADTTESMIGRLMFDVLVSVDASGRRQVPMLAAQVPTPQNGGVSADGLTIAYKLRRNVRWHDGAPFTSADVKFTWEAICNPANDVVTHNGYDLVRSVETPDAYTVIFHLKQPFAPAVNTLFGESDDPYEVLPAHLLARYHDLNRIPFNAQPIGTGPFVFKRWIRGDRIELAANDGYFLGRPKLRGIVLKIMPDENTELAALRTRDIDWQFEASPSEAKMLAGLPGVRVILQERNEVERIQLMTEHPPLDDLRARQAIAYAIDTKALVRNLTDGTAMPADQDLPPFLWAHASDVKRYPYDPQRAAALLAQAGWLPGSDGIRQKNGRRLSLQLAYNVSNATRRSGTVQIQAMLRRVGIEIQLKPYQGSLLFATMGQGGILQNGRFDLAWTGWVAGIDPDNANLYACWAKPPNGQNESRYCNPRLDAAEMQARMEYDMRSRKAAYAMVERTLSEDVPDVFLWWPRQLQPTNPAFEYFTPNPITASWNAYQWDI